jgi:murein DD-endopeptidase MepM/ murein hydrolase activator NlpD
MAPDWAAGPGTPLSVWALRPEEAAPFDPLQAPRTHRVAVGDTLYALSVRYQIPLRPLIEANRLDAPFTLRVGQSLALPPPRTHRVRRGETLVAIARRYNIDARSLALLNRLPKPYAVRAGDTLALPALARGEADEASPPAPPVEEVRPPGPSRFAWPLRGTVLARFGPQAGGRRLDGVDIAGREGDAVKAAADGRVVYAGDDLEGYGKLMLVQHDGGWVTAYAYCARFAAKEGDRVTRGQKLAEVGKGADGVAKLHFQVRRGDRATDPLAALPPA